MSSLGEGFYEAPATEPRQTPTVLQAAVGGPIGLLVNGDMVTVRPAKRELSVALSEEAIQRVFRSLFLTPLESPLRQAASAIFFGFPKGVIMFFSRTLFRLVYRNAKRNAILLPRCASR